MKKGLTGIFILCLYLTLFGQQKQSPPSFIIKGQVINEDIPEYKLVNNLVRIDWLDQFDQGHSDSTHFDDDGNFFLETNEIVQPVRISLNFDFDYFQNILAAPGYEITFSKRSKNKHDYKLTGFGSNASNYYRILDSIPNSKYYSISWGDLNETEFINQLNHVQSVRDSVAKLVFDNYYAIDPYMEYFGRMTRMDNKFEKLKYLFSYGDHKKWSYEKVIAFVRNNFDADFFNNPGNDEYLISSEFRNGVTIKWPGSFLNYLLLLDNSPDPKIDVHNLPEQLMVEKANTLFKGAVRDYVLYKIIAYPIWTYKSIVDLNKYKNQYKPYYSSFSETTIKNIENAFSDKIKRLAVEEDEVKPKEIAYAQSYVGNPAPPFALKTRNDFTYKLEDFKGKVVLLDLWSSWCNVCSIENKALKKIYRKYKKDKRIEFIGIGVFDTYDDWLKAIKKDRPPGLQLFDKDHKVYDDYIDEHIPKFVLIDRKGNVVNFMAPKPGEGDALLKLIKQEIEKKK